MLFFCLHITCVRVRACRCGYPLAYEKRKEGECFAFAQKVSDYDTT